MRRSTFSRRVLAAALTTLLAASGLAAVGFAAPATAAGRIVPCSEEVQGNPVRPSSLRPAAFDAIETVDIILDVEVPHGFGDPVDVVIREASGFRSEPVVQGARLQRGVYEFVMSGDAAYYRPDSPPGRYRGGPANQLALETFQRGDAIAVETRAYDVSVRFRINYFTCDSDGDGVPEHHDSCPSVVNPGQEDFDRDRAGDACDPDDDGDGAADVGDNCLWLANDQADSDGDGIGNACDSTPYPPAPTPTTSPAPGTTPPPTTGTTTVATTRSVSLRYAAKRRVFKGTVASNLGSCLSYASVSLWRKKRGADRLLVVRTADHNGRFRTPKVRKRGAYYVTVEADPAAGCGTATSRTVRVRRR